MGEASRLGRLKRVARLAPLALVPFFLAGRCSGNPPREALAPALARAGPARQVNVVLIVSDTTRRDRMGIYGGPAKTPAFDAFARSGLLFDRAFTQSPWTKPSIATLFTSLYPTQHWVASHPSTGQEKAGEPLERPIEELDVLGDDARTIAEVFRDAGYVTAAIQSNPWLDRRFGFAQGFDQYDDSFAKWDAPGSAVSDGAADWLARRAIGKPYFLYLHYVDAHRPYGGLRRADVKARLAEIAADQRPVRDAVHGLIAGLVTFDDGQPVVATGVAPSLTLLEMAYDRGIEEFDLALGRLLGALDRDPERESTAVIVTADHGEALFTRGYGNHGRGLFDDEVAIPLAMRLPGVSPAAARVSREVGLIDLLPTLCDYVGAQVPQPTFGLSILKAEPPGERDIVTEGVMHNPWNRSIRNRHWLLTYEPGLGPNNEKKANPWSLYDLQADPAQRLDVLAGTQRQPPSREAIRELQRRLQSAVQPFMPQDKRYAPLEDELRERLRSLGYVQ